MLNSTKHTFHWLEVEQAEKVAEYNAATFHPKYSRRCATCKKFFVGGDWRFAETLYCSEQCEFAAHERLAPSTRHRIKMFWRDFGKDIKLYEEITHERRLLTDTRRT